MWSQVAKKPVTVHIREGVGSSPSSPTFALPHVARISPPATATVPAMPLP